MEFNKHEFAKLLQIAKGDRSINKFGLDSDVDPGYISRLMREKINTPPSPSVIKRLSNKAYNGISYERLMTAAGYLDEEGFEPDPNEQFFLRAEKLSDEGKKKLWEFLDFVELWEADNKKKKQNKDHK